LSRYEEAIVCYEKSIQLKPTVSAYFNKALVLQATNRFIEAIENYNKVIDLKRNHFKALMNKGVCFFMLNNTENALKYYEKAIRSNPCDSNIYTLKGKLLNNNLKNYKEAMKCLDKAICLDANNYDAYLQKGDLLYNLNKYEDAIEYYDRSIQINPNNSDVYFSKGCSLKKLNRLNEAIENFEKSIQLKPSNLNAHLAEIHSRNLLIQEQVFLEESNNNKVSIYLINNNNNKWCRTITAQPEFKISYSVHNSNFILK
jgi:tetratricopeptide (TPR) repeat protein